MTDGVKVHRILALVVAGCLVLLVCSGVLAGAEMFHYPEQRNPLRLETAGSNGWSKPNSITKEAATTAAAKIFITTVTASSLLFL